MPLPPSNLVEPMSTDMELDLFLNPLLASPLRKKGKKKEVQSSNSEMDLFAPPLMAPLPASSGVLPQVKKEKGT